MSGGDGRPHSEPHDPLGSGFGFNPFLKLEVIVGGREIGRGEIYG